MTAQRPAACSVAPLAYKVPIVNMDPAMTTPPSIIDQLDGLRPQLSVNIWVKMVNTMLIKPETPEARKEAVLDDKPACLKRTGA